MLILLTDQNFEKEVLKSNLPVLVDFWAPWCVDPKTDISLTNGLASPAGELPWGMKVLGWSEGIAEGKVSYSRVVSDAGHCLLLRTTTGREIKVTEDHLFYTPSGWKKAAKIQEGGKVAILPVGDPLVFKTKKKLIISLGDIKKIALPRMKISFYIKDLIQKGLLPLYQDNPKILILARLMGALFTDGNLYQGKNNLREVSLSLGDKRDIEAVIRDLEELGFKKIYTSFRETPGDILGRKFINRSFKIKCLSTSCWLLFRALGVPAGNKTNQDYSLPSWLMKAPKAIKKEFLAAFLGGDGPRITIRLHNKLLINDLEFHKSQNLTSSGIKFAKQLKTLFEEFAVKTRKIFTEEEKYTRIDGSRSVIIHLQFASDFATGLAISQKIGYRYCLAKQLSSMYAGEFLRLIQQKKKEWEKLYQRVLTEGKKGLGYRRISRKLGIPPLLAFNWIKRRDVATSPKHFLKFPSWLKQTTKGLKDGFVWGEVASVRPIFLPAVARITVEKTHNLIANGFLVHNCGPCQMLAPVIEEVAKEYEGKIKVGKLNVDGNPQMAEKYGIMSIPTLLIFKNGDVAKQIIGIKSKEELEKIINEVI